MIRIIIVALLLAIQPSLAFAQNDNADGRIVIKGGGQYSTSFGDEANGFDFKFTYVMELWTSFRDPVVICTVIWEPKDPERYKYYWKDSPTPRYIPVDKLKNQPKVIDLDLHVPIAKLKGIYATNSYDYIACNSGAMGEAGIKSFNTPSAPGWEKLLIDSRFLKSGDKINTQAEYAKDLITRLKGIPQNSAVDTARVDKVRFNTAPLSAYLENIEREKRLEEERAEQEFAAKQAENNKQKSDAQDEQPEASTDDFWNGGEPKAVDDQIENKQDNTSTESFWSGGEGEEALPIQSNDFMNDPSANESHFWQGTKTANTNSQSDFWDGGIEPGSTDFSIEYKDGKEGVVNSYGDILIPFRDWKILSYQEGMASVEKNESNVKYNKCVFDGEDRWYYNVFESETGIVNRDGEYISSPQRKISGQVDSYKELTLTVTRGDCDAGCEARYARRKRERAAASRRCKQKMQNELQSLLSHYESQGYTR